MRAASILSSQATAVIRPASLSALSLAAALLLTHCGSGFDRSEAKDRGADYNVQILRDTYGVPHIFGKTDADAAYGLGFAHAEDDYDTMVEAVLMTRGKLASVQGMDAVPVDYMVGLLKLDELIAEKWETSLSPEIRRYCQAYADGVNHWAALNPNWRTEYLHPVTGQDIVAGFVLKTPFFFGVDSAVQTLFQDERQVEVSEKVASVQPDPFSAAASYIKQGLEVGSNSFAVAPSRSEDGYTRLAVNSHQPWDGPVAWYEAHLFSEEGLNIVGGVFPGSPVVLHGHNEHLGWAHTVNGPDLVDIYVLEMNPDNDYQYKFDGKWRELERREITIDVRVLGFIRVPVTQELLWSVHGPVIRRPHGVYAIRYAAMDDIRQVEQWFRMNKAATFDEWMEAMRMQAVPSFNSAYADKEGNIGYINNTKLPKRAEGYDWEKYLPGNTSETLWTEYHDFEASPQVWNPASGWVQNCNNTPWQTTSGPENPKAEDYPSYGGWRPYMTNRGMRAMELFSEDEAISRQEFYDYKHDMKYSDQSIAGLAMEALLGHGPGDEPIMQEAFEIIRNWDMTVTKENRNAALPVMAMRRKWINYEEVPAVEDLLESVKEVAEELKEYHGRLDPEWGEVMRLRRGSLDLPLGGGPDILRAIYGNHDKDGTISGLGGDCYYMMVEWDSDGNITSESIHQYGSAITVPDSPHYSDQSPLFAAMELKPVYMSREALQGNLTRAYIPGGREFPIE